MADQEKSEQQTYQEQQTAEDKNSTDDGQQKDQQQSTDTQNSMNLALIGGVVGASMGLLASPDTGKKVAGRIGQSEMIKGAGRELRRTAQEIITEQAMITLRQTATGYWNKYEGKMLGQGQEKEITEDRTSRTEDNDDYLEQYKELKEENKNLNENVQRIEEKLNALLEAKG